MSDQAKDIVWTGDDDWLEAKVGHLFAFVKRESWSENPRYEWFVAPDDEDKCYRRALVAGECDTASEAQEACKQALNDLARAILDALWVRP